MSETINLGNNFHLVGDSSHKNVKTLFKHHPKKNVWHVFLKKKCQMIWDYSGLTCSVNMTFLDK